MLDPQNDFNSPCYDDTFRRNYFFKEYRDFGEYFLELDYWIMREAFVSRIGSPLNLDQTHYDTGGRGAKIFRDLSDSERASIVSRGYFLGDETVECGTSVFGDIYHVTELYVYVPKNGADSKVFSSYTSEVVNFPALVDFDCDLAFSGGYGDFSYNTSTKEVGFKSDRLAVGDTFYMEREERLINGTWHYGCRSDAMTVLRRSGELVYAKASDFTRPKGEVLTAKEVLYDNRNVAGGKIRVSTPLETLDYRSFEFLCGLDEVGFATEKLSVGDEFFLDRPFKRINSTEYEACRSSMMTVSRREGDLVYAKAASFANSYTGDTYSAKAILFDNRNVDGGIIFVRAPTKRWGERSLQVSVRRETAFFAAKPEIREKFAPTDQLTGIETGQIDSGTTPSYKDYRQLMASGGEIRSAPSTVEEVYKGLWRRDDFYTTAR